jgi:hypothetical protein
VKVNRHLARQNSSCDGGFSKRITRSGKWKREPVPMRENSAGNLFLAQSLCFYFGAVRIVPFGSSRSLCVPTGADK